VRARAHGVEAGHQGRHHVVQAEGAGGNGDLARVDPIGDVDVVPGQQQLERAPEPGGEVAGQGRDHQHARARVGHVLGEAPERAEGRGEHDLLPHLDRTVADARAGEAEWRLLVRGAGTLPEAERGRGLRQRQGLRAASVPVPK
jgi:hypothetical protein